MVPFSTWLKWRLRRVGPQRAGGVCRSGDGLSPPRRASVCKGAVAIYSERRRESTTFWPAGSEKGKVQKTKGRREDEAQRVCHRRSLMTSPLRFILLLPLFLCTQSPAFAGARAEPRQQSRAPRNDDASALLAQALELLRAGKAEEAEPLARRAPAGEPPDLGADTAA